MESLAKYKVVLSGNVIPEYERHAVIQGLANLFSAKTDTMESLLKGSAVPLKKQYDKAQATTICNSIRKVGAQCTIEKITEPANDTTDFAPGPESKTNPPASATTESAVENEVPPPQSRMQKFQTLLMQFVGHNTEYYQRQFSKFGNPEQPVFKPTWHWAAFSHFFFWALYRKMWRWAAINGVGGIGLVLWVSPGPIYFLWLFLWALIANYLYFKEATTAVSQIVADPQVAQQSLARGGVSKRAIWGGLFIALISALLTGNYTVNEYMNEYGDQIKDVLPGSGTQIRGDGSTLQPTSPQTKLGETSLILSGLATSLKVLLLKDDAQNEQSTRSQSIIAKLIERFTNGEIHDGWGGKMRIEQQVDRYDLISSGPDKIFKTDDDVIQPVMLPWRSPIR